VTYGPLLNRATQLAYMYEGVPSHPDAVDKYKVTQLYTAPTAIRALMRSGTDPVTASSRASLQLLGSVGEPINPEAWRWYHQVVGEGRCPIVDTWWQTETGGIMITPLPTDGFTQKPGCASRPFFHPFFGIQPVLLTPEGVEKEVAPPRAFSPSRAPGRRPFVDVLGDYERYVSTYFPIEGPDGQGYYLTGDGARRDEDGYTVHLDHRTGRRRHQLVGPPHRHRRGRVGRGATPTHITPSPGSTSSIYDRASVSSLSRFPSLSLSLSLWTLVALPRRMLASLLTLREHARKAGWGALPLAFAHLLEGATPRAR
jgi:hypothetical protein